MVDFPFLYILLLGNAYLLLRINWQMHNRPPRIMDVDAPITMGFH
jgi:hypothetical protein